MGEVTEEKIGLVSSLVYKDRNYYPSKKGEYYCYTIRYGSNPMILKNPEIIRKLDDYLAAKPLTTKGE